MPDQTPNTEPVQKLLAEFPVLIVTGLSGGGKSTALNVLEDMRFFTVDGLPSPLAPQMVQLLNQENLAAYKGLAIGLDVSQSHFVRDFNDTLSKLAVMGVKPGILFIEAKDSVILTRYATTRRPHPLERVDLEREGLGLEQAIALERKRLQRLREMASLVLDTSSYSIHDLRRVIQEKWGTVLGTSHVLRVHLISFGFKYGVPAEADMVFDLRFLPNPYFNEHLKPLSGLDASVQQYVLGSEPGISFLKKLEDFLLFTLPLNQAEGRFRMTIAIGCTGGRHRSVAVTEALASTLKEKHFVVSTEHRHLALG